MVDNTKKYDDYIKSFHDQVKITPTIMNALPSPDNKFDLDLKKKSLFSQNQNMGQYQNTEVELAKRFESYKVKQRMINFTLKTFNKVDLKSIMEHWISKFI